MIAFWFLFLIAAWGVLAPRNLPGAQARVVWGVVGLLFAVIIGLRHEVGADWFNYLGHFKRASQMTFGEAASMVDPGHYVLNMWIARLGGSVYAVNFAYAVVMMGGTIAFCRKQPNPWLALLVAVPYMLVVVGMGYTRQSVALGLALAGLVALGEHRIRTFVIYVAVGALFHKSAVLLLPIAVLASSRNRLLTGAMVLVATGFMYYLVLADNAETLWTNYVEADRESQGGAIRVFMNAVPAALLLLFRRTLVPDSQEQRLWLWMAIFAFVCVPLVAISSTAVDRVALYLIPLQLFVFSRLPRLAATTQTRTPLVVGIMAYYAAVQFVWLNYASHSEYWKPYKFMPLI